MTKTMKKGSGRTTRVSKPTTNNIEEREYFDNMIQQTRSYGFSAALMPQGSPAAIEESILTKKKNKTTINTLLKKGEGIGLSVLSDNDLTVVEHIIDNASCLIETSKLDVIKKFTELILSTDSVVKVNIGKSIEWYGYIYDVYHLDVVTELEDNVFRKLDIYLMKNDYICHSTILTDFNIDTAPAVSPLLRNIDTPHLVSIKKAPDLSTRTMVLEMIDQETMKHASCYVSKDQTAALKQHFKLWLNDLLF